MLPSWVSIAMLPVTLMFSLGAARAAWRGTFQLNLVTWGLWATVPVIAAAAALAEGSGLSAVSVLATGLGPALILGAGLMGRATKWAVTRADLVCGALAVAAAVGWLATGVGLVAVVLAVAADGLAAMPTVHKAWRYPRTESPWGYVAGVLSGVTGLVTLDTWGMVNWLFPAYVIMLCAGVLALIATPGRGSVRTRVPSPGPGTLAP